MKIGKHVVVVGAGGNIGSHLCSNLARLSEVGRITLVDPDFYTADNRFSQSIDVSEVGKPKCQVQARNLRRIRSDLRTNAIFDRVENVAWGLLRADVLCACVDTRIARIFCNEIAWRLGMPWIDAGVSGSTRVARVNVYIPSPEGPCLECGFNEQHYASLELAHPCRSGGAASAPASGSPAYLGGLAAALQAAECAKLLAGDTAETLAGREVRIDVRHHTHLVSSLRRNPCCRFDHVSLTLEGRTLPPGMRLRRALLAGRGGLARRGVSLAAPGRFLTHRLHCPACATVQQGLQLIHKGIEAACPTCGAPMVANPMDLDRDVNAELLPVTDLNRTLSSLGFRTGEVIRITGPEGARHFILGKA